MDTSFGFGLLLGLMVSLIFCVHQWEEKRMQYAQAKKLSPLFLYHLWHQGAYLGIGAFEGVHPKKGTTFKLLENDTVIVASKWEPVEIPK